jgi:hypothetical protein
MPAGGPPKASAGFSGAPSQYAVQPAPPGAPLPARGREILLFLATGETSGGPGVPGCGTVQKRLAALLAGRYGGEFPVTVGEDENRREIAGVAGAQFFRVLFLRTALFPSRGATPVTQS